jgi:NAD(P)-dependent dehydrogenase (short-subunit alcohol dehydrogenase family)
MRVVVIGGSGIIGSEVVKQLSGRHQVLECSRSTCEFIVDITSPDSIRRLFEATGVVDAVVCAAGEAMFKPLVDLSDADIDVGLRSKLMGQINVVRLGHGYVRDGGSFTLTSGVTARRPIPASVGYSLVNAALEGFVRGAALDLPRGIRINAVSPQWVDVSLGSYGMDPAWGVAVEFVARGYVESVEGSMTGTVIDAGWQDTAESLSVGLPVAVGVLADRLSPLTSATD